MKNLPLKIRELREDMGWTQKDLAGRCGVSPRTVENWEQGRTHLSGPSLVMVKTLIAACDRAFEEALGLDGANI